MHCFSQVFVCSQSDVSLLFSQHSATDRSRVANLALCRSIWRLSRERLGNFDRQKRAATNLVTFSALGENVGTDASTFYRQSDVKVRPQLITSMNSGGPSPVSKYCGLWVAGQWYRSLSGTTILQMKHKLAPQNAILDWIGYFTPCLYTQLWSSKQLRVWDCLEIWDIFTAGRFLIGRKTMRWKKQCICESFCVHLFILRLFWPYVTETVCLLSVMVLKLPCLVTPTTANQAETPTPSK